MPFLHWDVVDEVQKLKKILSEKQEILSEEMRSVSETRDLMEARIKEEMENDELCGTEKLYWMYVDDEHPLHIRRTLDQFYYHTFEDTNKRDEDQTGLRYYEKFKSKLIELNLKPVLTMVDQLWMWVLPTSGRAPPTIITAFPQRCNREKKKGSKGRNTALVSNILDSAKQLGTRSHHGLAEIIAGECSKIYLDTTSERNNLIQFLEIYTTSIGDIVRSSLLNMIFILNI